MLLRINPDKINTNDIQTIIKDLNNGGIIIYPTDTVYALGCMLSNNRAFERLCKLKNIQPEKANFSIVCHDLSHLSDFTKPINNTVYKLMKRALPGPFTFILEANSNVPKLFKQQKKTVGIRVPNNAICKAIVKELGHPILSTSVHDNDEIVEYTTDPEAIYDRYKEKVEIVIDGGYSLNVGSTIIDCSSGEPSIIRQGAGIIEL